MTVVDEKRAKPTFDLDSKLRHSSYIKDGYQYTVEAIVVVDGKKKKKIRKKKLSK